MDIRKFDSAEIAEINSYVITQVPQTILPQLFVLTEEPIKKIKSFIAVYRIVSGCKDFVEKNETKEKLNTFLDEVKKCYELLYSIFIDYDSINLEYVKHVNLKKMLKILLEHSEKINEFVNSFLVFAEKQELISTDTVSGIKLDGPEGEDLYEKIVSKVKD